MPVLKVPVIHKFGIISHCQRLQLQSRLYEEISPEKSVTLKSISNPFEVSDEFVDDYNDTLSSSQISSEIKLKLKQKSEKIFLKIKRRIGLKYNCETENHINLALGWTELAILSQCDGSIGQESLELLYISLNTAPISNRAFSVLFYLLETVLYFIQVHQFQLETPDKHIKWLLIGEIVAIRIYLQCVLKLSQGWKEKLDNLTMYIKDFKECYSQYTKYPDLILSFCVIEEVTDYLITIFDVNNTTDEELKGKETLKFDCGSFLWHAVDLCRCISYSSLQPQIQDCINGIRTCMANNSALGEWMECYLAIRIIANAACFSELGFDVFISILHSLVDVNHSIVKINASCGDISNKEIAGFEKGSLLLLAAMRELSSIPIVAKTSLAREKALSSIAEIFLSKTDQISAKIPLGIQEITISRVQAIFEICENNSDKSNFNVIKNSIWCLLKAVKRKRILPPNDNDYCEKYGKVLSTLLYSNESYDSPETANNRITKLLIHYLLPVFPSSKDVVYKSTKHGKDKIIPAVHIGKREQIKFSVLSKRNVISMKEESNYKQHADDKLRSILENYWNQELPQLEKRLDLLNLDHET